MELVFRVCRLRYFRLVAVWILIADGSSAQVLTAPESVQANPDGTFQYTVEFVNGSVEVSLYSLKVFETNTDLAEPIVDWFCEFGIIPPGAAVSFAIPSDRDFAKLIDPTREGRVDVDLILCGADALSVSTRILPSSPRVGFDSGDTPVAVAVVDFDRDANLDLVTANHGSHDVTVLLGNGDGTFQDAVAYPVAVWPQSVAVADFNRDARLDLVTANAGRDDVSVLLGRGDGTFQPSLTYGADNSSASQSAAVADFNRDGASDIVTANFRSNDVRVYINTGSGDFWPGISHAARSGPAAVAAADLDGDTAPDIAVANQNDFSVSVLLGDGNGNFETEVRYPVGSRPGDVAVADLNQDGVPDLVTSNSSTNDASVLLGNGNGTFGTPSRFPVGEAPQSVAVADLDGDAILDLIVANALSEDSTVLLGNGDGSFKLPVSFSAGIFPSAATVADVDENSVPDVVVANSSSNNVTLVLNPFDSSIHATIDIKPGSAANRINRKGRGLIPVALLSSERLDVADIDVSTLGFGPKSIAPTHDLVDPAIFADHLGDVDGDGFPDLVSHYSIQGSGLSIGDNEACLGGKLLDGRSFEGCDSVSVVNPKGRRRARD